MGRMSNQNNGVVFIIFLVLFFGILFIYAPAGNLFLSVETFFSQSLGTILNNSTTIIGIGSLILGFIIFMLLVFGNRQLGRY